MKISNLKTGYEIKGKFCHGVDEVNGVICGIYSVVNANNEVRITFQPEKCWQPMPGKDWVSAYRYEAKMKFTDDHKLYMKSEWIVE